MRTTIEMRPEHRARLLEVAARRGEKGFSKLVEEALDSYFEDRAGRNEARRKALRAIGSLSAKEGEELREATRAIRENWR